MRDIIKQVQECQIEIENECKYGYVVANYFNTKKDAKKNYVKEKIYGDLKKFASEHNTREIDWEDRREKYCICYNYKYHEVEVKGVVYSENIGQIYFSSKQIAYNAIEKFGEENIRNLFE